MAATIQIRRSPEATKPSTLAQGEPLVTRDTLGAYRFYVGGAMPSEAVNFIGPWVTNDLDREPLPTDDLTAGYRAGWIWIDQSQMKAWLCLIPTPGNAVWMELTGTVPSFDPEVSPAPWSIGITWTDPMVEISVNVDPWIIETTWTDPDLEGSDVTMDVEPWAIEVAWTDPTPEISDPYVICGSCGNYPGIDPIWGYYSEFEAGFLLLNFIGHLYEELPSGFISSWPHGSWPPECGPEIYYGADSNEGDVVIYCHEGDWYLWGVDDHEDHVPATTEEGGGGTWHIQFTEEFTNNVDFYSQEQ